MNMSDPAIGHPIGRLICGGNGVEGIAKVALDQLSASVDRFGSLSLKYLGSGSSDELTSFGPFCARVLLENACAALVGRLDPFRMLYLSEFQAQPEYEHNRRAKSAFAWTGDVLPDDKAGPQLWSVDNDLPKISRALFSRHFDHVYWRPALEAAQDFLLNDPADAASKEILDIEAEKFISQYKGRSSQLYSTLSKSVHWEFFTSATIFDEVTVKASIRDACATVAVLGFVSHFIPTAYSRLDAELALSDFRNFYGAIA